MVEKPDYWTLTDGELKTLANASREYDEQRYKFLRFCAAMVAAEVRNTIQTKSRKVWTYEDFMPREVRELTLEQQRAVWKAWAQRQGGTIIEAN